MDECPLPFDVWHEIVRALVHSFVDDPEGSTTTLTNLSAVCRDLRSVSFPALVFVTNKAFDGSVLISAAKSGDVERLETVSRSVSLYRRKIRDPFVPTFNRQSVGIVARGFARGNLTLLRAMIVTGSKDLDEETLLDIAFIFVSRQSNGKLQKGKASMLHSFLRPCPFRHRIRSRESLRWFAQRYPKELAENSVLFQHLVEADDPQILQDALDFGFYPTVEPILVAKALLIRCLVAGKRRSFRWLLQRVKSSVLSDPEWTYDGVFACRQSNAIDELFRAGVHVSDDVVLGLGMRWASLRGNLTAWQLLESSGRLTLEIAAEGCRRDLPRGCCRHGNSEQLKAALDMQPVDFDPWMLYQACLCSHLDESAAALEVLDSRVGHLLSPRRFGPLWKTALRNASVEKVVWFWERRLRDGLERSAEWHSCQGTLDDCFELVVQRSPYTRANSRKSRPPIEPILDWGEEKFHLICALKFDPYLPCANNDNFTVARWLIRRNVWISEIGLERLFKKDAKRCLKLVLDSTPPSVFCRMFAGGLRWESFNARLSPSPTSLVSFAQRALLDEALTT